MAKRLTPEEKQANAEAKLKAQQQAFVEHYLETWNAAEAARRAGYSAKTARQQGSRLLTKVDVRQAIEARLAGLSMGANEVLARLTDQASASMEDFVNPEKLGVRVVDLKRAADRGKLHLVKKVTETQHGLSVELHDPQVALIQLGRALGLFVDKTEHSGTLAMSVKGYVDVSPDEWPDKPAT